MSSEEMQIKSQLNVSQISSHYIVTTSLSLYEAVMGFAMVLESKIYIYIKFFEK